MSSSPGTIVIIPSTISYNRVRREHREKASRLFFVSINDLWDLTKKYKIRPGCRDSVDITSVTKRVEERILIVTPLQLKWLLAYSSRGISLDDSRHNTRYNIKLATLMVADEKDRGLPAAFLLSNTMTTDNVSNLFKVIKELMPDFNPRRIVTDEAQCFWNGFRKTSPDSSTELHYCRIHIAKTWERKTKEVVDAILRPSVDKALRELLKETRLHVFEQRFAEILAFLNVKGQTVMAEYLSKNYLGKTTSWASFTNKGAIMETTMISERWHRTIKDDILHRNANCRLDCLIELLIRATEEKADTIEIMDRRRFVKSSFRVLETIKNHQKAVTFYGKRTDRIRLVKDNEWRVETSKEKECFTVLSEGRCSCNCKGICHVAAPQNFINVLLFRVMCIASSVVSARIPGSAPVWKNKSGVSCVHIHAVKTYACEVELVSAGTQESEESEGPLVGVEEYAEVETETPVETPEHEQAASSVQHRREQRYQRLNEIISTYAAIEMTAKTLAKSDSDESLKSLDKILEHLKLAAAVVPMAGSAGLAPRPELTKGRGQTTPSKCGTTAGM
ncbi:hypothetical protein COOONC_25053 [Cooperia oncophora]